MTKYHDWEIYDKEENQLLSDMMEDIGDKLNTKSGTNHHRAIIQKWVTKNKDKWKNINHKKRMITEEGITKYLEVRVYCM